MVAKHTPAELGQIAIPNGIEFEGGVKPEKHRRMEPTLALRELEARSLEKQKRSEQEEKKRRALAALNEEVSMLRATTVSKRGTRSVNTTSHSLTSATASASSLSHAVPRASRAAERGSSGLVRKEGVKYSALSAEERRALDLEGLEAIPLSASADRADRPWQNSVGGPRAPARGAGTVPSSGGSSAREGQGGTSVSKEEAARAGWAALLSDRPPPPPPGARAVLALSRVRASRAPDPTARPRPRSAAARLDSSRVYAGGVAGVQAIGGARARIAAAGSQAESALATQRRKAKAGDYPRPWREGLIAPGGAPGRALAESFASAAAGVDLVARSVESGATRPRKRKAEGEGRGDIVPEGRIPGQRKEKPYDLQQVKMWMETKKKADAARERAVRKQRAEQRAARLHARVVYGKVSVERAREFRERAAAAAAAARAAADADGGGDIVPQGAIASEEGALRQRGGRREERRAAAAARDVRERRSKMVAASPFGSSGFDLLLFSAPCVFLWHYRSCLARDPDGARSARPQLQYGMQVRRKRARLAAARAGSPCKNSLIGAARARRPGTALARVMGQGASGDASLEEGSWHGDEDEDEDEDGKGSLSEDGEGGGASGEDEEGWVESGAGALRARLARPRAAQERGHGALARERLPLGSGGLRRRMVAAPREAWAEGEARAGILDLLTSRLRGSSGAGRRGAGSAATSDESSWKRAGEADGVLAQQQHLARQQRMAALRDAADKLAARLSRLAAPPARAQVPDSAVAQDLAVRAAMSLTAGGEAAPAATAEEPRRGGGAWCAAEEEIELAGARAVDMARRGSRGEDRGEESARQGEAGDTDEIESLASDRESENGAENGEVDRESEGGQERESGTLAHERSHGDGPSRGSDSEEEEERALLLLEARRLETFQARLMRAHDLPASEGSSTSGLPRGVVRYDTEEAARGAADWDWAEEEASWAGEEASWAEDELRLEQVVGGELVRAMAVREALIAPPGQPSGRTPTADTADGSISHSGSVRAATGVLSAARPSPERWLSERDVGEGAERRVSEWEGRARFGVLAAGEVDSLIARARDLLSPSESRARQRSPARAPPPLQAGAWTRGEEARARLAQAAAGDVSSEGAEVMLRFESGLPIGLGEGEREKGSTGMAPMRRLGAEVRLEVAEALEASVERVEVRQVLAATGTVGLVVRPARGGADPRSASQLVAQLLSLVLGPREPLQRWRLLPRATDCLVGLSHIPEARLVDSQAAAPEAVVALHGHAEASGPQASPPRAHAHARAASGGGDAAVTAGPNSVDPLSGSPRGENSWREEEASQVVEVEPFSKGSNVEVEEAEIEDHVVGEASLSPGTASPGTAKEGVGGEESAARVGGSSSYSDDFYESDGPHNVGDSDARAKGSSAASSVAPASSARELATELRRTDAGAVESELRGALASLAAAACDAHTGAAPPLAQAVAPADVLFDQAPRAVREAPMAVPSSAAGETGRREAARLSPAELQQKLLAEVDLLDDMHSCEQQLGAMVQLQQLTGVQQESVALAQTLLDREREAAREEEQRKEAQSQLSDVQSSLMALFSQQLSQTTEGFVAQLRQEAEARAVPVEALAEMRQEHSRQLSEIVGLFSAHLTQERESIPPAVPFSRQGASRGRDQRPPEVEVDADGSAVESSIYSADFEELEESRSALHEAMRSSASVQRTPPHQRSVASIVDDSIPLGASPSAPPSATSARSRRAASVSIAGTDAGAGAGAGEEAGEQSIEEESMAIDLDRDASPHKSRTTAGGARSTAYSEDFESVTFSASRGADALARESHRSPHQPARSAGHASIAYSEDFEVRPLPCMNPGALCACRAWACALHRTCGRG